jgi:type VI secretion system protein VasI
MRLGRDPAVESKWGVSTTGDSAFFPGDARTFLSELQRHDQLVLRLKPAHGNVVTATFDIRGLSEAAKPLQEAMRKR